MSFLPINASIVAIPSVMQVLKRIINFIAKVLSKKTINIGTAIELISIPVPQYIFFCKAIGLSFLNLILASITPLIKAPNTEKGRRIPKNFTKLNIFVGNVLR